MFMTCHSSTEFMILQYRKNNGIAHNTISTTVNPHVIKTLPVCLPHYDNSSPRPQYHSTYIQATTIAYCIQYDHSSSSTTVQGLAMIIIGKNWTKKSKQEIAQGQVVFFIQSQHGFFMAHCSHSLYGSKVKSFFTLWSLCWLNLLITLFQTKTATIIRNEIDHKNPIIRLSSLLKYKFIVQLLQLQYLHSITLSH